MDLEAKEIEDTIREKISIDNIDKYVFTHGSEFKKNGIDFNSAEPHITEGYVKITADGKTIYRKLLGANINAKQVQMSYRSMKELKINEDKEVSLEKVSWFGYYWNNSDSGVRAPFKFAFISLILTLIGSLITLLKLITDFLIQ